MKYEVVWFVGKFCYTKTVKDIRMALALAENKLSVGKFCYTKTVKDIRMALALAENKLSEKEVDEIEIVKIKEEIEG